MKKLFTLMIAAAIDVCALAGTVITEQPEGQLVTYARSGQYVSINNSWRLEQQDGMTMDIVYADGGKVYLKNIVCGTGGGEDYWVEGQLNEAGNQISVPLGQTVYYIRWYQQCEATLTFGRACIEHDVDDYDLTYIAFYVDEDVTEAIYVIEGNKIMLQGTYGTTEIDPNDPYGVYDGYGLAAYDEDEYYNEHYLECYFCEWNTVLTGDGYVPPTPTEQCAKPEGGFENGIDFHGVLVTLINNEEAEGAELHYNITLNGELVVEDAVYDEPFALTQDGEYYIDFWATAPDMLDSSHGGLIFTIDQTTGLSELLEGKTIAGVRYYNMAGQEMAQPQGLTIVVTTYTDGTTSAAKVVK